MTKIEFQHAFMDAVENGRHASYMAHHAAFETAYFLNLHDDSELRDVEHVTLAGDWFVPVGADVCHTAQRNYGWAGEVQA